MTTYTLTKSPERVSMRVQSNDETFLSNTGALQVAGRAGARWMVTCTWRLPGDDYRALRGEIARLKGMRERAAIPMSILGRVRAGVGGGTPLVNGAHAAGSVTLAVKGMPNSTTGVLQPGDCLQVGNQLVELGSILTSDGSGNGSCEIWPPLNKNYADGTAIVYTTSAAVTCIMMSDYEIGSSAFGGDWFGEMTAEFMEDVVA